MGSLKEITQIVYHIFLFISNFVKIKETVDFNIFKFSPFPKKSPHNFLFVIIFKLKNKIRQFLNLIFFTPTQKNKKINPWLFISNISLYIKFYLNGFKLKKNNFSNFSCPPTFFLFQFSLLKFLKKKIFPNIYDLTCNKVNSFQKNYMFSSTSKIM